jgi:hypothetical protein
MLWRDPRWAGLLMAGYVLLSLAVGPDGFLRVGTGPVGPGSFLFGALAAAFLAWRVTRGGRVSRMLLIACTALAFAVTAFEVAGRFGPAVLAVLAACAAQLALLLSPAVYRRTRPRDWAGPAGWARVRPPLALLLLGVLAGLAVTLLGLSHLGPSHLGAPASGCHNGEAGRLPAIDCQWVANGFPLRWLAASHRALVVSWAAMLKDLSQYTVISAAALYGLWLGPRTREEPGRSRTPAAAIIGSALAGLAFSAVTGGIPLTWVTAGPSVPGYRPSALLADTALWALVTLGGCLAVRALRPPADGRGRGAAAGAVRPAGDGA